MMIATNPFMPVAGYAPHSSSYSNPVVEPRRGYPEFSTDYAMPKQRYNPTHFSYKDNSTAISDYSSVFSPSQTTYAPVHTSSSYDYTNVSPSYTDNSVTYTDNSQSYADYSNNPVYNDYSQQNYPVTNVKYVVKAPQTTEVYMDNSNRQINNTYNTYYYMLDGTAINQDVGYYPSASGYPAYPSSYGGNGGGYPDYYNTPESFYGRSGYLPEMGYGSSSVGAGYPPAYEMGGYGGQYYPQPYPPVGNYCPPQVCPPKPQGSGIGGQLMSVLAGVLLSSLQSGALGDTDEPSNSNSVNVTINNQLDSLQEQVAELKNAKSTTTYSRKKRYYSNDEA